jgi:hypothetical protein
MAVTDRETTTKRIYLIVAVAALIALSSIAVSASGPRTAPVPDAPAVVYVYWCHSSRTSEKRTCSGSTRMRPGKLDARARQ